MMSRTRVARSADRWVLHPVLVAGFLSLVFIAGSTFGTPPGAFAGPKLPAHAHTASRPAPGELPVSPVMVSPDTLWRGPDGEPLPFSTHGEAIEFLRAAEVVSRTELPSGWTRPQKLLLEKDGIQMHAIFRTFERAQDRIEDPLTGQAVMGEVKDSAMFEVAAYELSILLDLPLVPPTVRRIIDNRDGTLQLWIETAMTEGMRREQGIDPPNVPWWHGVMQTMRIFDTLLWNADRHSGNLLIDPDWRVWFIDHTLAFQARRSLPRLESITFCERRLWERLRTLSDDRIAEQLAPYLNGREIGSLLSRRARIVKHFEKLIASEGVDAVIFDYSLSIADWTLPWPE